MRTTKRFLTVLALLALCLTLLTVSAFATEKVASDTYGADVTQMLETPQITSVESAYNGVKITWNAVPGAAKYRVLMKTDSGWKTLWNTVKTEYTWTGAESGKVYTFSVRCLSADGKLYASGLDSVGKTIQFIARPRIKQLQNTGTGIKISWDAVPGAEKYKLVVMTDSGWKTIWNTVNTSYTWPDAERGGTYKFAIRCMTADGRHYTSAFDSTGKSIECLARPAINGITCGKEGIHLSWSAVSGAVKYKVLLKTDSGWKTLWNTSKRNYIYTDVESGKIYTFAVACVTADGKTYLSTFDPAGKSIKFVAHPVITKLESTAEGIKITWDAVPGAERYRVLL